MPTTPTANGITLSVCSIAFRNEPITDLIQPFAEIGFDAIEMFGARTELDKPDEELDHIRTLAEQAKIELLAIAPYFVLTRGQEEYDETMDTAKMTVRAANRLGVTKIRTFTDVADGVGSDIAEPHHWDQAVKGLQQITAMDPNLQFVVETHGKTLADTVESCEQLIERVDAPNLKINFQPNDAFFAYGLNDAFDRLQPHITHMHLQQAGRDKTDGWLEEPGTIDFPNFIDHIIHAGYSESISIEYCWKDVPWDRVRSGHDYLRNLLSASPVGAA